MTSGISTVKSKSAHQTTHFELVENVFSKHQKMTLPWKPRKLPFSQHHSPAGAAPPRIAPGVHTCLTCRCRRELSNGSVECSVDQTLTPFRPDQSAESLSQCSLFFSFNRPSTNMFSMREMRLWQGDLLFAFAAKRSRPCELIAGSCQR